MTSDFKDFERDAATGVWRHRNAAAFDYSDGDVHEEYVLSAIQEASDLSTSSTELAEKIIDWPSMYHLSRRRANLLRPATPWFSGKRVLEIGSGCGAISRFLGEAGAQVVGLEGSFRRARIARARCRDLPNVEILCGTSDDADNLGQFDAVLLIGVLEYARKFLGEDGTERLLASCRARTGETGVLIVAIENQLGMKYLSGEVEDHVGIPMFGVENRYSPAGVTTFGRRVLGRLLHDGGFPQQDWWFPFPDYKMPMSVLSEAAVSDELNGDLSPLITETLTQDPQRTYKETFSPERAWLPAFSNGLGGDLANSFLVFASPTSGRVIADGAMAYHYAAERRREFAKEVRIDADREGNLNVVRSKIFPDSVPQSAAAIMTIEEDARFSGGRHWEQRLRMITHADGWCVDDFVNWFGVWFDAIVNRVGLSSDTLDESSLSTEVSSEFIDATPRNLLVAEDGRIQFIDLEWSLDRPIELGYLLFRGVYVALGSLGAVATPKEGTPTSFSALFDAAMQSRGLTVAPETLARYIANDVAFTALATGKTVDHAAVADATLGVRTALFDELARSRAQLVAYEADAAALRQAGGEKDNVIERLSGDNSRLTAELQRADIEFTQKTNELDEVRTQSSSHVNLELQRVNAELMAKTAELDEVRARLSSQLTVELQRASIELTEKTNELEEVRSRLSASLAEVADMQRLGDESNARIELLNQTIASKEDELLAIERLTVAAAEAIKTRDSAMDELARIKASRGYALEHASGSPASLQATVKKAALVASIILPEGIKAPIRYLRRGGRRRPD